MSEELKAKIIVCTVGFGVLFLTGLFAFGPGFTLAAFAQVAFFVVGALLVALLKNSRK